MSRFHEARIGRELTLVCRHLLLPREASFPLQVPVCSIRALLRQSPPGLPTVGLERPRIDAVALAAALDADNRLLAVEFIRAWAESRFEMPTGEGETGDPPRLLDRLDLLKRPSLADRLGIAPRADSYVAEVRNRVDTPRPPVGHLDGQRVTTGEVRSLEPHRSGSPARRAGWLS